jgi:hypothetical protein
MDSFAEKILPEIRNKYLLEVSRKSVFSDVVQGFVLDYSEKLILLACVDDNFIVNGYSVVPCDDIKKYRVYNNKEKHFKCQATSILNLLPLKTPNVIIKDFNALLLSVHTAFPIVTVFCENKSSHANIGIVSQYSDKLFHLLEVDADAEWDRAYCYYFKNITRVDFGGGYENALWAVAEKDIKKYLKKATVKGVNNLDVLLCKNKYAPIGVHGLPIPVLPKNSSVRIDE